MASPWSCPVQLSPRAMCSPKKPSTSPHPPTPRPVCVCGHITGVGQFAPPTEADPSVPHQSTAQQPSFSFFVFNFCISHYLVYLCWLLFFFFFFAFVWSILYLYFSQIFLGSVRSSLRKQMSLSSAANGHCNCNNCHCNSTNATQSSSPHKSDIPPNSCNNHNIMECSHNPRCVDGYKTWLHQILGPFVWRYFLALFFSPFY